MFSGFSGVCFTENKWSTENIFLVNGKSSHFSVKCLTDFKSIKHFTEKFFFFFCRKIFSRKSFFEKYFLVSCFTRTKRSLNCIKYSKPLKLKLHEEPREYSSIFDFVFLKFLSVYWRDLKVILNKYFLFILQVNKQKMSLS